MKIVLAVEKFFPDTMAGTEIYVLNLAKFLQQHKHNVFIVASNKKKDSHYFFEGIEVFRYATETNPSINITVGLEPSKKINEFVKIISEIDPQIVHFHSINWALGIFHMKLAKELGTKIIFTSHLSGIFCVKSTLRYKEKKDCNGWVNNYRCLSCYINSRGIPTPLDNMTSLFINKFILTNTLKYSFPALNLVKSKTTEINYLANNVDKVVAISKWMYDAYRVNNINNATLVEQGINSSFLKPVDPIKDIPIKNQLQLIYVGRITPIKGVHLLLEAMNKFADKIFLTIISPKDESDYYIKMKHLINQQKNCSLLENLTQTEVGENIEKCDVLCLPTIIPEAAPLVILEALAKKIPVIGSDLGGIKDMIQHDVNGLLFKSNHLESLILTLQEIINHPELLIKLKNNIKKVRTFEDVGNDVLNIYTELMTGS